MQKTPTANEQHLVPCAASTHKQHHADASQPLAPHTNPLTNTPSPSAAPLARLSLASPTTSPSLSSLVLTDSPSSQLSLASRSQPPSPSSPPARRHDSVSAPAAAAYASSSDSACAVGGVPVTSRARVPLSQVVTSLTQRWSREYLAEAEAGCVDAQCLVAQMYLTGWGALAEDQAEGRRWLARAKAGGIAGTVHKLERLYLAPDEPAGYHSGYGHTPQVSPSAAASGFVVATPTASSFFASVAATISPKPAPAPPAPLGRSASLHGIGGGGRLSVPGGVGSGGSSGDEQHSHALYHAHHWHWHQHGRGHSGELGVSAS